MVWITDFLYPHMAEGVRELSGSVLYKSVNPVHEGSTFLA